jgi:hypothetical protein
MAIREPAHPSKRIPGSAPPMRPIRSAGPKAEPAFRTTPGASVNKSANREPAFRTRPGPGSDV